VIRWPLREALRAYRRRVKLKTLAEYRFQVLSYQIAAPWAKKSSNLHPPDVPEILRNRNGNA